MQGVHPMASAAPVRKAPPAPPGRGATPTARSGRRMTPATISPLAAMKIPATTVSSRR